MLKAQFLKSAVWSEDYPDADRPEIAMVGRSNAGKSSLINAMIGPTKIAKTSSAPGKTRLLNFFDVGNHYRLVDLPGYGFAAREEKERLVWEQMIGGYFEQRGNLLGIILICDIRRQWTRLEQMILDLSRRRDIKIACVLSKADKLTRNEINKQIDVWVKTSARPKDFFHLISSLKKTGVEEFEEFIFKNWVKKK